MSELAARAGGDELLRWLGQFQVSQKGPRDLVTEADLASQQTIRQILLETFSDHHFLGEEEDGGPREWPDEAFCWIVDPLDGTRNYVHGLRSFSVSIALVHCSRMEGDRILAGTVWDPVLEECFTAGWGAGAFLNGVPIRVSRRVKLREALLVCSFPSQVERDGPEVTRFLNLLPLAGSIRRLGSAALNLGYLACGRLDAYWASSLSPWDVAAGALLVTEAGGTLTDLQGNPFDLRRPLLLATSTEELGSAMLPPLQVD